MLRTIHLELKEANELVAQWHRHHKPVQGHRFSIGCFDDVRGEVVGAAIIGRPVARYVDQHQVVEITRLVTDGTQHACSFLYGAAARAAKELGYKKIQTYILESEPGTSLKAAGWEMEVISAGGDWNCAVRTGRRTDQPMEKKQRWAKSLNKWWSESEWITSMK